MQGHPSLLSYNAELTELHVQGTDKGSAEENEFILRISLEDPLKSDFPMYFSFLGSLDRRFIDTFLNQLDDLDLLLPLQIHHYFLIRIQLNCKLTIFTLRSPLL